jgi:hypothetical protein
MKKIILSILAIALTVGAVSGTAYALFSSTIQAQGITMTSGNANLQVADNGTNTLISDWHFSDFLSSRLTNLYPGKLDYTELNFTDQSASAIDLNLAVQLTSVGGDWGILYNKIEMAISDTGDSFTPPTSGWATLDYWYNEPRSFGSTLVKGTPKQYKVFIRVKNDAGNEIAGKYLNNVTLTFTGTQK